MFDIDSLDPPARPGETILWCPMCGVAVHRELTGEYVDVSETEKKCVDHFSDVHGMAQQQAIDYVKGLQ